MSIEKEFHELRATGWKKNCGARKGWLQVLENYGA